MDKTSLVTVVRRIILAGPLLVLGAGFNIGCGPLECPDVTTTFPLVQTDAGAGDGGIDDAIARCQASPADCMPLCNQLSQVGGDVASCERITVDGGGLAVRVVAPSDGCD